MRSPIYWHRLIYLNTYGRSHPHFWERYEIVSALIRPGSSVLDLCCGDADLFTHYLSSANVRYTGVDISLSMAPRKICPRLIERDARKIELPVSDYVVMVEALYHFHPDTAALLRRMRAAARGKVIVLEQVQNRISRLPSWLSRFLSDPGDGSGCFRFDLKRLEDVVDQVDRSARRRLVCDGYDQLIEMEGAAGR